jgi:hypothetical protein
VGLERGPLSLVSTIEERLGRKSSSSRLENRDYGRKGSAALTTRHPFIRKTDKRRSLVRSRTKATELLLVIINQAHYLCLLCSLARFLARVACSCIAYFTGDAVWIEVPSSEQCDIKDHFVFTLVSCLATSPKLKTEATSSAETSVPIQCTICLYIPADTTIQFVTVGFRVLIG